VLPVAPGQAVARPHPATLAFLAETRWEGLILSLVLRLRTVIVVVRHRIGALLVFATVCAAALFAAVPPQASAHTPLLQTGGRSQVSATVVKDPAKSWAIYGHLDAGGSARYFTMDLRAGDRLWLAVLTPDRGEFAPSLAIMGPGLATRGTLPGFVEVPAGSQVQVVSGERKASEYEPFTPGAYVFTASADFPVPADGSYSVAVFDAQSGGPFSLAVGYEEGFTFMQWVTLPFAYLSIYRWEGDAWLMVLWPLLAVLLVGLLLIGWGTARQGLRLGPARWLGALAGLLCLGTAGIVLFRGIRALSLTGFTSEAAITLVFIVVPVIIGWILLGVSLSTRIAAHGGGNTVGQRMGLAILGLAALGSLAGYIVGPIMAVLAALMPARRPPRGR
jgi:hypothetical protein